MPRRKETTRARRLNDQVIEQLRQAINRGIPWHPPPVGVPCRGYADLIFLVDGLFYPITDYIAKDDRATQAEIWSALREDIIAQHIKHSPGSRTAAWWRLEDREPREKGEDERDYLKRLNLLTQTETDEEN